MQEAEVVLPFSLQKSRKAQICCNFCAMHELSLAFRPVDGMLLCSSLVQYFISIWFSLSPSFYVSQICSFGSFRILQCNMDVSNVAYVLAQHTVRNSAGGWQWAVQWDWPYSKELVDKGSEPGMKSPSSCLSVLLWAHESAHGNLGCCNNWILRRYFGDKTHI